MQRKKVIVICLLALALLMIICVVPISRAFSLIEKEDEVVNATFLDNIYSSNRFTRADSTTQTVNNEIVNLDGFDYVCQDGNLRLYVDKDNLGIRIENTDTGYIWGSSVDTTDQNLNKTWKGRVTSALWISYYHRTNVRDELKEETISQNSITRLQMLDNGFKAHIKFIESKIELDFIVTLANGVIKVDIPYEGIIETQKDLLAVIKVYPFFGSMLSKESGPMVEGYTLIPDGSGALIRYKKLNETFKSIYTKTIYGKDYGLNYSNESDTIYNDTSISIPLVGFVHGINRNAAYIEAKSGDEYARITSYEAGKTTEFYWTTYEFIYRNQYQNKISKSSSVLTTQENKNEFDIRLDIKVLGNEEANYVGIANDYHDKLVSDGILKTNSYDDVPLHITFLASEIEKTTFSNKSVPLTTTDQMINILTDIKEYAPNLSVSIQGWSGLGYSGVAPYYDSFNKVSGGKKGYKELIEFAKANNINLYFEADYQKGFDRSKGYSKMEDIAQMANSDNIMGDLYGYKYYYLNAKKTYELFSKDIEFYRKHNIDNICLIGLADMCYSNWDADHKTSLLESINIYKDTLSLNENNSSYGTFAYVYPYVKELYRSPMYSSQVNMFTDTIPFISYVLNNSITLYGEYLNNITDLDDEVLRMIDYNIYPSIRLTDASAINLMDTPSRDLVSSKYTSWKKEMMKQMTMFDNALKDVLGHKVVKRQVISDGVVVNTYDNNVKVYINYLNKDYTDGNITIQKNSIKVGDSNE